MAAVDGGAVVDVSRQRTVLKDPEGSFSRYVATFAAAVCLNACGEAPAESRATAALNVGVFGHSFDGPLFDSETMIPFLREARLDTYVYTDDWARELLREPHTPEALDALRDMTELAGANDVTPVYNMKVPLAYPEQSPFPNPGGRDRELDRIVAKVETVFDAGVRIFMLAFDDVQIRAKASGLMTPDAQVAIILAVERRLSELDPETRLWVVPPYYQGTAETIAADRTAFSPGAPLNLGLPPSSEFIEAYGALPSGVEIFSTGAGIFSPGLTASEARGLTELWGHQLMFWHNYPINDLFKDELVLQPFDGVEPATVPQLSALILHRMPEGPQASKIALLTLADFAADPEGYDPAASYAAAIQRLGGTASDALRVLADQFQSHPIARTPPKHESAALRTRFEGFWAEHDTCTSGPSTAELQALLSRFTTVLDELEAELDNRDLLEELRPHAEKLAAIGEAGLVAVRGLESACSSPAQACATATALDESRKTLDGMSSKVTQDSVSPSVVSVVGAGGTHGPTDIVGDFLARASDELSRACNG